MTELASTPVEAAEAAQATDWKGSIPQEVRFNAEGGDRLERFKDVSGLAKSYFELESSQGGRVKMLDENSTPEEKSAFYQKMGTPAEAGGYTRPEILEGETFNEDFFNRMTAVAHKEGASDGLFSALTGEFNTIQKEAEAAAKVAEDAEYERHITESDRLLHEDTEFGGEYDKNVELSKRAYTEYFDEDFRALLDPETGKYKSMRNEPGFIKAMAKIAKAQMDDTFIKGEGPVAPAKDDFVPSAPNSPEMYRNGEDEESIKSRAYFTKAGFIY
jgi:hypothetical protein